MILLGAYNALGRWGGRFIGMDLSSNGLLEAQWYAFSLLFLLGAQYTLKHNDHVRVDVVYDRLSLRAKAYVDLLGSSLLLVPFCIAVIYFTLPGVVESWTIHETSPDPGGLPRYPLKAVVPLAFFLVLLQGISEIAKRVLVLRGALPEDKP